MSSSMIDIRQLNDRSRDIFRQLVDTFLETGDPVGSRTLSRRRGIGLSAASIRNVMADLEDMGLLSAPHTSAGRLPTEAGLRLFVDGMLQVGDLPHQERQAMKARMQPSDGTVEDKLSEATALLAGLTNAAGLVLAPKHDTPIRHIEFVPLAPGQALAILVGADGSVENRVLQLPVGLPPSALTQAGNYLNARMAGHTLNEAHGKITQDLASSRAELDELTAKVVKQGLATWAGDSDQGDRLIIRGQSALLDDVRVVEDLERIRQLFDDLETKKDLIRMLESADDAEGVRIFIGSETNLFSLSGSSVIAKPYMNQDNQIVGVVGVIGPTRINYARVIPMVDYTATLLGRVLGN